MTEALKAEEKADLLTRARAAFVAQKRAWTSLKPAICRPYFDQAAWQRLTSEVELYRLDGSRQRYDDLLVNDLAITRAAVEGNNAAAVVRVTASGRNYVVDKQGQLILGARELTQWVENWTFERTLDSAQDGGRAEVCTGCGAPLTIDADGLCIYCRSPEPPPANAWVVVSITKPAEELDLRMNIAATGAAHDLVLKAMVQQAEEERAAAAPAPVKPDAHASDAGIAAIKAHDPNFAVGDFIVEAREVFIALEKARSDLDLDVARPVLADNAYAFERARIRDALAVGRKRVHAYLEIGAVNLVEAGVTRDRDRIVVRVEAVSADHLIDIAEGRLLEGGTDLSPWSEQIAFERKVGVLTEPLKGGMAHLCPVCMAAASVDDAGDCRSCGRHVTDGAFDWVVTSIEVVD